MRWTTGWIAVDWGTTNRRAYLLDPSGRVTASFSDERGLRAVSPGGFDAAVADIRQRLGDLPMLLAGMVGSREGWREAGYVPCPAGVRDLGQAVLWIEPDRTGIVPGVSQHGAAGADVMRGEEVQVLGAMAGGLVGADAMICHPGTHAKWIELKAGRIASFRTAMTGELFSLLSRHSILAPQLRGTAKPDESFDRGVDEALRERSILTSLFRIRAGHLLDEAEAAAASYASGLLVGSDVGSAIERHRSEEVVLVGRPDLCALYARALELSGQRSRVVDGAEAFVAGIRALAENI